LGRRVFTLAACASLFVVSCDSETIDLLPPQLGEQAASGGSATPGGEGASASTGKEASAGDGDGDGRGGDGGATGTTLGGTGGNAGCAGLGCAGGGFGGLGGSSWTGCDPNGGDCKWCERDEHCPDDWHCSTLGLGVECASSAHCRQGFACDLDLGRCAPACDDSLECELGTVCDPEHGTCVECLDHRDCPRGDNEDARYCAEPQQRCVECLSNADCDEGPRRWCVYGSCIECIDEKHCGPDQYCDIARGRCEP
jgi:hypothetical protein